ncbi:MAG TPA: hypothetical protein VGP72_09505 [Planctomycetota bacterium]
MQQTPETNVAREPIEYASKKIPWTRDLDCSGCQPPETGTRTGTLAVALAQDEALMLKASDTLELLNLIGGFALVALALVIWLGLGGMIGYRPRHTHIWLAMVGIGLAMSGLTRYGLLYTVDGLTGTLHCQRRFQRPKSWTREMLRRIVIIIQPGSFWQSEKIVIQIRDEKDKVIETFCEGETKKSELAGAVEIAIFAGRLLKIPVELHGQVVKGDVKLAFLLQPQDIDT